MAFSYALNNRHAHQFKSEQPSNHSFVHYLSIAQLFELADNIGSVIFVDVEKNNFEIYLIERVKERLQLMNETCGIQDIQIKIKASRDDGKILIVCCQFYVESARHRNRHTHNIRRAFILDSNPSAPSNCYRLHEIQIQNLLTKIL